MGVEKRRSGLVRWRFGERKTTSEPIFIRSVQSLDVSIDSGLRDFEG